MFFVISGFLITTLLLEELQRTTSISLKWFYIRRGLRIFPAAYTYIAVMFLCSAFGWVALRSADFLHAITYTVNYEEVRPWHVIHLWSLSVEEQFYFVWPAVLLLVGRRRGLWVAGSVIVAAPILRVAIPILFPKWSWMVGTSFQTNADALAAGCVLAGARSWLGSQPEYLRFLQSAQFLTIPMAVVAALLSRPFDTISWTYPVMNIGIALVIDRCVRFPADMVGRILNSKLVGFVGVLSYSAYLWQEPFLNRLSTYPITSFPINLMLTSLAALASYYLIERPCLTFRKRIEHRWYHPNKQMNSLRQLRQTDPPRQSVGAN